MAQVEHTYEHIGRIERKYDVRVWVFPPNPLAVFVAQMQFSHEGFAVTFSAAGASENDALGRLDSVLEDIAR